MESDDEVQILETHSSELTLADSIKYWYKELKSEDNDAPQLVKFTKMKQILVSDLRRLSRVINDLAKKNPLQVFEMYPQLGNLMNLLASNPVLIQNHETYETFLQCLWPLSALESDDLRIKKIRIWALRLIRKTVCSSSKSNYQTARSVGYGSTDCYMLHIEKMISQMSAAFRSYDKSRLPLILEVLDLTREYPTVITRIYSDIMNWLKNIPRCTDSETVWQKISDIVYTDKIPCEYSCRKSLWINHRRSLEIELLRITNDIIRRQQYISAIDMETTIINENLVKAAASSSSILQTIVSMLYDLYKRTNEDFRLLKFSMALFGSIQQLNHQENTWDLSSYPACVQPLVNILSTSSVDGSFSSSLIHMQLSSLWNLLTKFRREQENCSHIWWVTCSYPEWQLAAIQYLLFGQSTDQQSYTCAIDILVWFNYHSINDEIREEIVNLILKLKKLTKRSSLNQTDIKNLVNKTSTGVSLQAMFIIKLILFVYVISLNDRQNIETYLDLVCGGNESFSHLQYVMDMMDLLSLEHSAMLMKPRVIKVLSWLLERVKIDNDSDEYCKSLVLTAKHQIFS